jgi:hypothetical protein
MVGTHAGRRAPPSFRERFGGQKIGIEQEAFEAAKARDAEVLALQKRHQDEMDERSREAKAVLDKVYSNAKLERTFLTSKLKTSNFIFFQNVFYHFLTFRKPFAEDDSTIFVSKSQEI